ncbi:hypothetical protein PGIGA_G00021690 [Pangasianodon gigas]|uniref:Uncharacterized protein n=1 Tax=Pangasianodon gigas TaxID=30993 RepID=A0ACC5WVW4_PANGG|nr:hypothetical protein [Pangasianodon gigas]
MAAVHVFLLLQFILSLVLQSSALMSDYKTCGDDACARLMCRVQAVRDHHAQDCRFLSFKKGDMIDVYHKLTQKRSDLWAGSTDKEFGYFPKDAVKIDEVFVDEKKEIEMSTQKTDFFCMDAFGTIIASGGEFEDYEFGDQTAKSEELGNSDFDDRVSKASETNDNVEMRHVDNDNKDRGKPEQSGSSWIGSAVSGWFANDADEAGNGNKEQEKFKSRKLALDLDQLDEDQLDEGERQTKILDWIGDGLTNTFGFGKNDLQANSKDETENNEDLPNEQSSYLLGNGIKNALGFGRGGGDTPPSETKKLSLDENMQNLREQQEATSLKAEDLAETITENEKIGDKKDAGWYDSVYNRITKFYGDPSDKSEASKDEGKESLSDRGMDVDKVTISKDEKNPELRSESSQRDRNPANQDEKQEVKIQDQSGETSQLGEAWYGNVYNRITGFYGDTPDGSAGDAPDKSEVIENGRGDPQVTSETADVQSSRDKKLDNTDHTAENNNAGWYDSVYSRISNMYGDTSDKNDVPDVMKDVESQTQSENTKDTSSPSMFSINGLSAVMDSLRSPSKGAESDDETTLSETVTSEPSLTQSQVSSDQSDVMTLRSDDDDDTMDSGLTEKENTDNITDIDQSQDTSQSIFSVNRLSMMINSLKSPFKPNDAGDKEESDGEKTSDTGKEGQSDNDDKSDNDDELSVRPTDGISEILTQRAALGSKQEEEEEVVQEVNVAEAQINIVESSLDCNKQDMGGDGEKISTDISTSSNDIHADIDEFNDQSDSGSAHLSTGQSKNMTSVFNTDETETLTEEPGWTELAQHASDTSKSREGDASTSDINKSIPETDQFTDIPGEEEPQSESETRSDSGLQIRTDVLENNSETVDETDEAQDEGEAADVLPETEEAGMKVRSSETAQTIHTASNDEKHGVDVTQMEYGGEKESDDATQIKYSGENKSVNITLMEYDEERENGDIIEMEHRGKKEGDDIKGMESGGEKEGGVTQMEYSGGQEDVDVAQMESDGEKEDINATQMETAGEKESLNITQMESGGEKEGGVTQMEYSGGQEDVNDAQMEPGGEKESIDIIQVEYARGKNVVDAGEDNKSGEVTQVEYAGGQGVDITHTETDGEKESDITQAASDGKKEGVDLVEKEELSLHAAHGLENTHSISETKQNLEIDPDDSRETEKRESAAVKQAEITPKNIQDKTPSKDGSETEVSTTSDGDQNDHVSKQNENNMVDVKHQITPTSAQTQKRTYPNLQAHLSEENIQDLLKFFHGETLSWLDFNIGHSEYIKNEELAELQDFEQTLEHLKTRNQEIKPSLQTIHTVLAMLRKKFIPVLADGSVDKSPDPSQTECVSEKCVSTTENTPISEQDTGKDNIMDNNMDKSISINDSDSLISKSLSNDQEVVTDKSRILDALESDQKTAPQTDTNIITEEFLEPEESQNEGLLHPYTALVAEFTSSALAFVVKESAQVNHVIHEVVMSLPDDIRPGPDLYGVPWEAVIFTATIGLFTFLLFTCRFIQAIKSRLYCSKERRMGQKVADLLEEKCKVLETLSECEHKFKKLETALQNGGLSAQDSEREDLEGHVEEAGGGKCADDE